MISTQAATFLAEFATDRRHMRGADGSYNAPPPARPPVRGPRASTDWNLDEFWDVDSRLEHRGAAASVAELKNWLGTSGDLSGLGSVS